MNKIKDLWQNEKKTVILYGGGLLLLLILIIIIVIIILNVLKRYTYPEIESIMVKATEKYLKENPSMLPNEENPEIIIDTNSLIEGKYMKEFKKLSKDTECFGDIAVIWNAENIRYVPTLECSNYKTTNLYDAILSKEKIIEENKDGLYKSNEHYIYRGEFVNNYIVFAGFSWRIFKFDDKMMYLVLADTINQKNATYVYDDRYNEMIESNRGKNSFENSRVYLSLKDIYNNDFSKYKNYILPINSCTHTRSETDYDKTGSIECSTTYKTFLSLMSVYDYLNASLDPLCTTTTSRNCSNYNYLAKAKNKWWLLNGTNENTYEVYYSDSLGKINLDAASSKKDLRPVLAIPSNSNFKSGDGSSAKPYTIYEY